MYYTLWLHPVCAAINGAVQSLPISLDVSVPWLQDSAMPDTLASVCNNITFANPPASSSGFCQGFVYDAAKNIAFFEPQPASRLLDTSNLCSSPKAYTWLRTQGQLHFFSYLHCLLASCQLSSPAIEHVKQIRGMAMVTAMFDCIEEHSGWLREEMQQHVAAIAALLMLFLSACSNKRSRCARCHAPCPIPS